MGFADYNLSGATVSYPLVVSTTLIRLVLCSCFQMCHIIDNGNLHFIVQAKKEIAKGSEITIPFDFSYQDS